MPSPSTDRAALALAFVAVFAVLGLQVPYWPIWLVERGLSPEAVGVLLSLGPWTRVAFNPWLGRLTDRTGRARTIGVGLAVVVLASYVAFAWSYGFWALLVLSLVSGFAFSPIIPLVDAVAVRAVTIDGGYGKVRRYGSAAFIVSSFAGGLALERWHEPAILWGLIGTSTVLVIALAFVPRPAGEAPHPSSDRDEGRNIAPASALRWFMATTLLLHASHAMMHSFGTAYWRSQGLDDASIGALWSAGVIAEIGLFTAAPWLTRRLRPSVLLVLAGAGGLVRWPLLATTTALPWLFVAQSFHALTFAALHLGSMEFIRRRVPDAATARATGLYSAASGMALGIGLPITGWAYDSFGPATYFGMAVASGIGMVAAIRIRLL